MTPPPPPFGTFPKIHPFWRCHPSLTWSSCAEFLAHPMSPYWEWHHVTWSWALPHFLLPGKSWRCTRKHMHSLSEGFSRGRLARSENATNTAIRMLQVVRIIICQQFCPRDMLKRQTEGPFRSFWGPTTKKWLAKVNPVRIEDVCLTKYKCKHQEMVRKDLL